MPWQAVDSGVRRCSSCHAVWQKNPCGILAFPFFTFLSFFEIKKVSAKISATKLLFGNLIVPDHEIGVPKFLQQFRQGLGILILLQAPFIAIISVASQPGLHKPPMPPFDTSLLPSVDLWHSVSLVQRSRYQLHPCQ